ncbi:hypothetical protein LCGC14_0586150 [marine sediment metagenome]|uniref:Uncharacterized protein n=1 Tax=marine sediment metagenome TaxID=412755 RepID=A0A0F9RJT1_9ZZZZ
MCTKQDREDAYDNVKKDISKIKAGEKIVTESLKELDAEVRKMIDERDKLKNDLHGTEIMLKSAQLTGIKDAQKLFKLRTLIMAEEESPIMKKLMDEL